MVFYMCIEPGIVRFECEADHAGMKGHYMYMLSSVPVIFNRGIYDGIERYRIITVRLHLLASTGHERKEEEGVPLFIANRWVLHQ